MAIATSNIEEKSKEISSEKCSSFYQFKDNLLRIYVSFDSESLQSKNGSAISSAGAGQCSLFVLDYSSSMSGDWSQVQSAIKYFTDNADMTTKSNTHFIVYNGSAKMSSINEILKMRSQGCTSFESAFNQIKTFLNTVNGTNELINIIFMTDGQDNCTSNMTQTLSNFGHYINHTIKNRIVIHTIGFTAYHDRKFLEKLCNLSNDSKGIYRFANNRTYDNGSNNSENGNDNGNGNRNDQLTDKFEEMFDFLAVSNSNEILINDKIKLISEVSNCNTYDISNNNSDNNNGENKKEIDIMIDLKSQTDHEYKALAKKIGNNEAISVSLNGLPLAEADDNMVKKCKMVECDQLFDLKKVEIMEIKNEQQLESAQLLLNSIKIHKIKNKYNRKKGQFLQYLIQLKLNKYYQLFSNIKRGLVSKSDESVISELNSLRYETTFSKARQQRQMNKRIIKNMNQLSDIEDKLNLLEFPPNQETMDKLFRKDKIISNLKCLLSNDTIFDIMTEANDNIMVFTLSVERPEHLIDAPTSVIIKKYLIGFYSFEAIKNATKFAINENGINQALGGFIDSKKYKYKYGNNGSEYKDNNNNENNNDNEDNDGDGNEDDENEQIGLFRGCDGGYSNSYLPLYLNSEHFKRVEILLPPILGYFFTLDPFGFNPNQYLALYFILGHMLCKNVNYHNDDKNKSRKNEHFSWLVNDFTKLCSKLLPTVYDYLVKEKDGILGNQIKSGDLLNEWMKDENIRFSKAIVQNLLVLIGLYHCYNHKYNKIMNKQNRKNEKNNSNGNTKETNNEEKSDNGGNNGKNSNKDKFGHLCINQNEFEIKFTQELWRRSFGLYYKNVPRAQIDQIIDSLVFDFNLNKTKNGNNNNGQSENESESKMAEKNRQETIASEEANYEQYAKLRMGIEKPKKGGLDYDDIVFMPMEDIMGEIKNTNNDKNKSSKDKEEEDKLSTHFDVLIDFDQYEDKARLNSIIDNELKKIESNNKFVSEFLGSKPLLGENIDPKLRWLMVVQALRYHKFNAKSDTNDIDNTNGNGNNNNNKKDYRLCAFDCMVNNRFTIKECLSDYVLLKDKRMNEHNASLAFDSQSLETAEYIIYHSKTIFSFIGKILKYVPTRGGKIWDHMIGLLLSDKKNIGNYYEKVFLIFNGKYLNEYDVISKGTSWVHCELNIWKKFKQLIGFTKWKDIEDSMHGYYGWVYRISDIPNRHGHCNSHPNPALVTTFRGFGV